MSWSLVLAILWVAGWVIGGIAVLILAFCRCPKCRGWHTDGNEQDNCKGE